MALKDFIERLAAISGEGQRETDFRIQGSQREKTKRDMLQQIMLERQRNVQFNAYAPPGQQGQTGTFNTNNGRASGGGGVQYEMYPLKGNLRVTSPYGVQRKGHSQAHSGIDWAAAQGTPIYAPSAGTIRSALFNKVYGNQTILDFGNGYSSMFGHQSRFAVKPGQRVKTGQLIGYVGSTGWSTGPHLHFESWVNNRPVNPLSWFG
jgi:murein DD-endopeptidase MepM/ murein hydrolase activator NlpD